LIYLATRSRQGLPRHTTERIVPARLISRNKRKAARRCRTAEACRRGRLGRRLGPAWRAAASSSTSGRGQQRGEERVHLRMPCMGASGIGLDGLPAPRGRGDPCLFVCLFAGREGRGERDEACIFSQHLHASSRTDGRGSLLLQQPGRWIGTETPLGRAGQARLNRDTHTPCPKKKRIHQQYDVVHTTVAPLL
jgi:hypothetical protein